MAKRGAPKKDPRLVKKPIGLRLSPWIIEWLKTQENQSVTVEEALTKQHKLKPPKIKP